MEAAAAIFEVIFPGIEKIAHFLFNLILIVYLEYRAAPIFFVLIPITFGTTIARYANRASYALPPAVPCSLMAVPCCLMLLLFSLTSPLAYTKAY